MGPAGSITLSTEDVDAFDLHPNEGTEPDSGSPQLVLLRGYIARYPGTIWPPIADTMAALHLPAEKPMIVTEQFAHVVECPSRCKTYKSLADAIVLRDASKFIPGKSNIDWRKHLVG